MSVCHMLFVHFVGLSKLEGWILLNFASCRQHETPTARGFMAHHRFLSIARIISFGIPTGHLYLVVPTGAGELSDQGQWLTATSETHVDCGGHLTLDAVLDSMPSVDRNRSV